MVNILDFWFLWSSDPVDGNVSDVDNDSDDVDGDLIDDNDDLVSVATPDAAPADSSDDESSATEDYPPVDSDQDDDGRNEKFSLTNAPRHSMQIMVLSFTCHPKLQL